MGVPVPARSAIAFVIVGAILLLSGALFLTFTKGDPASALFQHVLTIQAIAALLVWFVLAWSARRLPVGKPPKLRPNSVATLVWVGSRISFLIATVIAMFGWLIALALGLDIATALVRAVVLLVVVTAFTGIIGGAFLNSVLAVRHWRGRRTE
ncbi:MAG: hypothetical protein ABIU10_08030 [Sphingomicrobium sp.]